MGRLKPFNAVKLHYIIIAESCKVYLNKHVDHENREGFFLDYKDLVTRVSAIVTETNPEYRYPYTIVSTTIEVAHLQRYSAEHLPRLTDVVEGEDATWEFKLPTNLVLLQIDAAPAEGEGLPCNHEEEEDEG